MFVRTHERESAVPIMDMQAAKQVPFIHVRSALVAYHLQFPIYHLPSFSLDARAARRRCFSFAFASERARTFVGNEPSSRFQVSPDRLFIIAQKTVSKDFSKYDVFAREIARTTKTPYEEKILFVFCLSRRIYGSNRDSLSVFFCDA